MKNPGLFFLLFASSALTGQTIILQPDASAGKDARIFNLDALGNFGSDPDLIASQLNYSEEPGTTRSLIQFDLTGLPKGAHVTHSILSLYYNPDSQTPGQEGTNASYLRRLIQPWEESTVAWNMQPFYTMENEVLIPASSFADQSYENIDVTALVTDMVEHPNTSFGFMFMLQTEQGLSSMKFASSDHTNILLHPKLEITYSTTSGSDDIAYKNAQVIPNPFTNSFSVANMQGEYLISIIDLHGKAIHRMQVTSTDNDIVVDQLEKLPVGIYFMKAAGASGNYFSKIVKGYQ